MGTACWRNSHAEGSRGLDPRAFGSPGVRVPNSDPWNATVTGCFRDIVLRYPHATAISDASGSMTYAQLWNFAGAFRARLAAQGIGNGGQGRGGRQPLIPTVAAIIGIVLAGGCYVPVDVEGLPALILGQLAELNDLRCWIADRDARQSANPSLWGARPVLSVEDISCPAGLLPASIPVAPLDSASPLYIMFTSGSTGVPKGVVVPHRAVARLVIGQNFIEFGPQHTFLLHSPLTFDASTLELWGPLLHGGRLAVAPPHRLGMDEYANVIAQQHVTTLWLTAAMFHLAAEHTPEMFASLTQLVFGGDVIAPRSVERIRSLYPVAAHGQRIRPHGKHHLHLLLRGSPGLSGRRHASDWEPNLSHHRSCSRPQPSAGSRRGGGRTGRRRCGCRAGISGAAGSHCGAFSPRSPFPIPFPVRFPAGPMRGCT